MATDETFARLRSPGAPEGALALLDPAPWDGSGDDPSPPAIGWPADAAFTRRGQPASADGIEGLFRTQAPQLLRFLNRRTRGHEDAADLLQEAFLRLIRLVSLEAFPASPEAYLQQIAGNLLRDRARRRSTRAEDRHEPIDEEALVDPAPGPADYVSARETLEAYEAALMRLKPKTRQIFLLHRREGLTYAQIAAEAGLSVSGVEKQMMKAIAQIDRALGRP